jgi:hypothetical protein
MKLFNLNKKASWLFYWLLCRQMVSRPVFADAFWRCYNTLKATATPEAGMPGYFRFLTLLSESRFYTAWAPTNLSAV